MPRVSFCIPTHDGNAKCQQYLFDIFYALANQTCKDFNVWISDHSKSDKILKACQEYADVFEINFVNLLLILLTTLGRETLKIPILWLRSIRVT